jgi:hypothetical protein
MQSKMNDVNSNMDKVFRDKLGDFQKQPPEEIWDGIRAGLGKKPRRKILIPLWQAAAGIALLITAGGIFYFMNRPVQNNIAEQFLVVPQKLYKVNPDSTVSQATKIVTVNPGNASQSVSSNPELKNKNGLSENNIASEKIVIAGILPGSIPSGKVNATDFNIWFPSDRMSEVYLLPVQQDEIPRNKYTGEVSWEMLTADMELIPGEPWTDKRLLLTAQVSPTYSYRDIGSIGTQGSGQFNQYESGKIAYSGGLQFGYKTSERLSIHAGLMYAQLGYNISQVERFYVNKTGTNSGTDALAVPEGTSLVYAANNSIGTINPPSESEYFLGSNTALNTDKAFFDAVSTGVIPTAQSGGKVEQNFQYLEIPFLLRYKIFDWKLGVNLLGGLSTNILVGNHASLTMSDKTSDIGSSQNIRSFNYMGNVGLGFDYNLGKNLLFTVEPQFKYFLNSINQGNLISNRPYMLGMFTGVKFIW